MCRCSLTVLLVVVAQGACSSSTSSTPAPCVDQVHNLVMARSDFQKVKPAMIRNFSGAIYRHDGQPACANGRPTVPMPGWVRLETGELHVPRQYDLIKSGTIRMTVRGNGFADDLCLNGSSRYLALPHRFCSIDLCGFIGNDICRILEQPGVHTLTELEEKLGFNRTLELPEPPNFLGISLLDVFNGEFNFGFQIETEGEIVLDLLIPTNTEWLQIGINDEEEEEDE